MKKEYSRIKIFIGIDIHNLEKEINTFIEKYIRKILSTQVSCDGEHTVIVITYIP